MKDLIVVQKVVRVLSVLERIMFVFVVLALISLVAFCFSIDLVVEFILETPELGMLLEDFVPYDQLEPALTYFGVFMIVVLIGAVIDIIVTHIFYHHELAAGTPFDGHIVKEMRRVGIISIAIAVVTEIIGAILFYAFELNTILEFSVSADITKGLIFLFVSFICGYGSTVLNDAESMKRVLTDKQTEQEVQLDSFDASPDDNPFVF